MIDLSVGDDLLLDVRDVADDVLGLALEHVVLDPVELVADLVEDREAVVEEVVEHLVQQPARALGEELLAEVLVRLAAGEEPRDRQELAVREGREVVLPDEDVELAGVEPLDGLVVDGEVEDGEEVPLVLVVVDLRPLPLGDDVLDVQGVPAEALGEALGGLEVGADRVDPGQPAGCELATCGPVRARLRAGARPGPADPGQAAASGTEWVVDRQHHVLHFTRQPARVTPALRSRRLRNGRAADRDGRSCARGEARPAPTSAHRRPDEPGAARA